MLTRSRRPWLRCWWPPSLPASSAPPCWSTAAWRWQVRCWALFHASRRLQEHGVLYRCFVVEKQNPLSQGSSHSWPLSTLLFTLLLSLAMSLRFFCHHGCCLPDSQCALRPAAAAAVGGFDLGKKRQGTGCQCLRMWRNVVFCEGCTGLVGMQPNAGSPPCCLQT